MIGVPKVVLKSFRTKLGNSCVQCTGTELSYTDSYNNLRLLVLRYTRSGSMQLQ